MLTRVLIGSAETLTRVWRVGETVTDPDDEAATVAITRLDGTAIESGDATRVGTGTFTYTLPASTQVDTWLVTWSAIILGTTWTETECVEIAGGHIFTLMQARTMPPALSETRYPTATLAVYRVGTESECEDICAVAFVPRFRRVTVSSRGRTDALIVPDMHVRAVRAVSIDGAALTEAELASIDPTPEGALYWSSWPAAARSIVVEYEHGLDAPPPYIRDAAIVHLRHRLTIGDTSIPQRAISFTAGEGGTYRLSTPSARATGLPEVDAAYGRFDNRLSRVGF